MEILFSNLSIKKEGGYFSFFTQILNILIKNKFKDIFIRWVYTRLVSCIFIHELRTIAVHTYVSILFCFSPFSNRPEGHRELSVAEQKHRPEHLYNIAYSFIKYNFSCCIFFILIDSYCIFIMQLCDKIILSIYNYLHMDLINKKNNSRIHSSRFLRVRREMLKNRLWNIDGSMKCSSKSEDGSAIEYPGRLKRQRQRERCGFLRLDVIHGNRFDVFMTAVDRLT